MQPNLKNLKHWEYVPFVERVKRAQITHPDFPRKYKVLFAARDHRYTKPKDYAEIMLYLDKLDVFLNMRQGTVH